MSGVCLLVGKAGPEAKVDFLEGWAGACPLMSGARTWQVGRAMFRSRSRGSCGPRMSLGSLSANGWGCVPVQLVAWPEASQHWHLQAVG